VENLNNSIILFHGFEANFSVGRTLHPIEIFFEKVLNFTLVLAFPVGEGGLTAKVKTDEARVCLVDMAGNFRP
jgi:hypothetical protein